MLHARLGELTICQPQVMRHFFARALAVVVLLLTGMAAAETPNRVTILYLRLARKVGHHAETLTRISSISRNNEGSWLLIIQRAKASERPDNRLAPHRAGTDLTRTWDPERLIASPVGGRGCAELLVSIFVVGRSCVVSRIAREN